MKRNTVTTVQRLLLRNDGAFMSNGPLNRSRSPTGRLTNLDPEMQTFPTKIGQYSSIGMMPRQQLYLAWRNYLIEKFPTMTYVEAVAEARRRAADNMEIPNPEYGASL